MTRVAVCSALLALAAQGCAPRGLVNVDFRASANEPFLSVEIEGEVARVRTINDAERTLPVVRRQATANGARVEAEGPGGRASVEIAAERCEDDMSGAAFPLTARITVDGVSNRGCARRVGDPPPSPA